MARLPKALIAASRAAAGSVVDLQQPVGVSLNRFGDPVSVERAEQQTAQDQKIQRSLQEFNSVRGFW
jgi:hypothetical protein